jgi:hypothetical protein
VTASDPYGRVARVSSSSQSGLGRKHRKVSERSHSGKKRVNMAPYLTFPRIQITVALDPCRCAVKVISRELTPAGPTSRLGFAVTGVAEDAYACGLRRLTYFLCALRIPTHLAKVRERCGTGSRRTM